VSVTSRSSTSRSEIAERRPVDEDLHHRAHVLLVEREALLLVVERGAEPLELADDRAAVVRAPLPHAFDERRATELLAARPLGGEQLLDLALHRDPSVVGAECPLRAPAQHPVVADQGVLD